MQCCPYSRIARFLVLAVCLAFVGLTTGGCPPKPGNGPNRGTSKSPADYARIVQVFTIGVTALFAGDDAGPDIKNLAEQNLTQVTQMAPEEPAGWANLGLLAVRRNDFEKAETHLKKALELAPNESRVYTLLGIMEDRRGKVPESVAYLRKSLELNPDQLKTRYLLAKQIEKQGMGADLTEAQAMIQKILEKQPENMGALLESARYAAKRSDGETLRIAFERIEKEASRFAQASAEMFQGLKKLMGSNDFRGMTTQIIFLQNTLTADEKYRAKYRRDMDSISVPAGMAGEPFEKFLVLQNPASTPAAPDTGLTFAAEPLISGGSSKAVWAGTISLNGEGQPKPLAADGKTIRLWNGTTLPFPGGAKAEPPSPRGILPAAFAPRDILKPTEKTGYQPKLQNDLVAAGAGGVRFYRQREGETFTDATAKTKLPAAVLNGSYAGVWTMDIESDGDLDFVLGTVKGAPVVARNNADDSFKVVTPFANVSEVRELVYADLDGEGTPDVAMLDAQGRLHLFANERAGQFRAWNPPADLGSVAAIAVGDFTDDGQFDLLALQEDGVVKRLSSKDEGASWDMAEIAKWTNPPSSLTPGKTLLLVGDLDNNGGNDLVVSDAAGQAVWLCDEKRTLQSLAVSLPARVLELALLNDNGRLDLVGVTPSGEPGKGTNRGTKSYHWQVFRPTAHPTGDRKQNTRISSFGIGSLMEIRAGLLVQDQLVTNPLVHFGLGEYLQIDAVRIIWANGNSQRNGYPQVEFPDGNNNQLKADQVIRSEQRLVSSCPYLFAWDGKEMRFITDCIWRSPLGLRINAQDTAGILQTEDWLKIRSDQIAPRNGVYDLRITAELWETHFFDHLSLRVVDHPEGTDIFVDERFSVPPPPKQVYATAPPQPVARAVDDDGSDVAELVRERDGRHVANFGEGRFQGVTRDHYIEVELPDHAPKTGPLWLIAYGWIHPTDSSINVALGQSRFPPPQGLSLEVPDANGKWRVAKPGLGFPEGKVKTILINLEGVFVPNAPRRLRLRTNLEIYWDQIQWAEGKPDTPLKVTRLTAGKAELRYRGFSMIQAKDASSPELPLSYDDKSLSTQRWRDLEGYYTRFGDVRELIGKVDDRYVIMNAGDELALEFPALPPPPKGWVRDYVFVGDGWVKDGNFNTTFSKTVLPLPAHDQPEYNTPPKRLEDDPVYRRFPQDWRNYHTRYVTPDLFKRGLRGKEQ